MCSKAGIKGFHTNHSLRATSATRLFCAGTDEQLIMKRTGHQSVDGVRSYKRTSSQLSEEVSDILNRSEKLHKVADQSYCQPSTSTHVPITMTTSLASPSPPSTILSLPPQSYPPVTSHPLLLRPPMYPSTIEWPFSNQVNPCMSYNNSTSTPGSFSFNSCQSVVINITK